MDIKIRRAIKEDCPRLLELIRELALYEKAPEQVTVTQAHFEASGFGEKPIWWAFVATVPDSTLPAGERIDGFALYYIRYSTWKGQAMYLEDILITDSQRGKGMGYILFQQLIEEAKEKGLNRIIWQVLEWNEPAINFYKKVKASFDAEWINCTLDIN